MWACQSRQDADHALTVPDVRAVRVALDVGVGVVLAVFGDPGDHRALHGHRAEPAKTYSVGLWVRKERWVSIRWEPTVIPAAVIT